ncbi:hypothetical protein C5Y96_09790 [Blastopirellula marina]|uniref:Uncharacterized protein n=1 Tax=Blastopirellula marina TaxID=124 RepID=A0A2S8FT13_9BACT|nr:hypothetical protein C5Y96_09790 [Blastopirellula marina]RCS53184.1 hypothetical protein DTL36_09800 [Bremerella cremea]
MLATTQQHESIQALAKQPLAKLRPTLLPTNTKHTIAKRAFQFRAKTTFPPTKMPNCDYFAQA